MKKERKASMHTSGHPKEELGRKRRV